MSGGKGGGGGGGAPSPSEYIPLAREQARLGNVNTYTPYGSTTFTELPSGQWRADTSYSPEVQPIYQQQLAAALNPDIFDQRVADATYGRMMNLLEPQYQRQLRSFEQQMANRGLPVGGEAYDASMQNILQAQNQAREQAALSAVLQGQQAANQAFGRMGAITGRMAPAQGQGADVMSAANLAQQGNIAAQQAKQGAKASNTGAAATLGAAYMLCAAEWKDNKRPIDCGEVLNGLESLPVERWNYIGDDIDHIGPYAEDFNEAFDLDGGKTISVIDAIGVLIAANKALLARVKDLEAKNG